MPKIFESQNHFNQVLGGALTGSLSDRFKLKEAITMADITPFLTNAMTAELLTQYAEVETIWGKFATERKLNNFLPQQFYELLPDTATMVSDNGGEVVPDGVLPRIPELTPYPTFSWKGSQRYITTHKNGARMQFSWEAIFNDQWDLISMLPNQAALLTANTEDALVHRAIAPSLMTGDNLLKARAADELAGVVKARNKLTRDALIAAIDQVKKTKVNGKYVVVPSFVLLVPPALAQLARIIVETREIGREIAGVKYISTNSIGANVEVVESQWISGVTGNETGWYLLPAGGRTTARETVCLTKVSGFEQPELRFKDAGGNYLGGGPVPFTDGSFDLDSVELRLRLIRGAGTINFDGIVYSEGTAS